MSCRWFETSGREIKKPVFSLSCFLNSGTLLLSQEIVLVILDSTTSQLAPHRNSCTSVYSFGRLTVSAPQGTFPIISYPGKFGTSFTLRGVTGAHFSLTSEGDFLKVIIASFREVTTNAGACTTGCGLITRDCPDPRLILAGVKITVPPPFPAVERTVVVSVTFATTTPPLALWNRKIAVLLSTPTALAFTVTVTLTVNDSPLLKLGRLKFSLFVP